jgi:SAM-dependent methyltransferase
MAVELLHEMKPELTPDEIARQRFVGGLRGFILNDLAADMRLAYDQRVAPAFVRAHGRAPADSGEVHKAMRADPAFKTYSALRVQAQRMVWDSVGAPVVRERDKRRAVADRVSEAPGSVTLNPDLAVPKNVSAIDVHLMPGSYVGRNGDLLDTGAVYDQGLAVFSMGFMGKNLDDIGSSMSTYIRHRFPEFSPKAILDVGCTVGHNTLPWKTRYPDAAVHGIDVAAPGLAYASARAKMQGREVDFHQMSADSLDFRSRLLVDVPARTVRQDNRQGADGSPARSAAWWIDAAHGTTAQYADGAVRGLLSGLGLLLQRGAVL